MTEDGIRGDHKGDLFSKLLWTPITQLLSVEYATVQSYMIAEEIRNIFMSLFCNVTVTNE